MTGHDVKVLNNYRSNVMCNKKKKKKKKKKILMGCLKRRVVALRIRQKYKIRFCVFLHWKALRFETGQLFLLEFFC